MGDDDKKLDLIQLVHNLDDTLLVSALLKKSNLFVIIDVPGTKVQVMGLMATSEQKTVVREFLNCLFPNKFEVN